MKSGIPRRELLTITILSLLCICCLGIISKGSVINAAVLNESKRVLIKGQTFKLKAYSTKGKTTWVSKKKSVATVNKKGKVTARKKGTAKIIAKNQSGNASCKVIVQEPKLSKAKLSLALNDSYTLKLKGTNQTVIWSSSNSNIVAVDQHSGKLTALSVGTSVITAKVLNKKYKCAVIVSEDTSPGSRLSPLYAYQPYTTDVYDGATYLGTFTIELLDYKDGDSAYNYVAGDFNPIPNSLQEYIYLKFKLSYINGSGGNPVKADNIVNYYSGLFDSSTTRNINCIDWAHSFESIEDMVNVNLYPGGSAECSKAILINKGDTPVVYRIQTGYNTLTNTAIYTWFSTQR